MSSSRTIYYVFSGRFPSEKAHALYIAKVADSVNQSGRQFIVVASNRGDVKTEAQEFFNNTQPLDVTYLPTIDLTGSFVPKKIIFFINYFFFTVGCFCFFLFKKNDKTLIFSNESLPSLLLSITGKSVVYEMHDYSEHYHFFFNLLYKKVFKILSQNEWKKEKLLHDFALNPEKIIVEPNGVEIVKFDIAVSKEEARAKLGLQKDTFLVVYTGHLFDWKGASVLAESARLLPSHIQVLFVGGSPADVQMFKKKYEDVSTVRVLGYKPHGEIPLWQKASDCLVLPNTATQNISLYYTSPMKLFEYMASGRPIIASDIPSIKAVVTPAEVTFVTPDDSEALAAAILAIEQNQEGYTAKAHKAKEKVLHHTWEKRIERILSVIEQ